MYIFILLVRQFCDVEEPFCDKSLFLCNFFTNVKILNVAISRKIWIILQKLFCYFHLGSHTLGRNGFCMLKLHNIFVFVICLNLRPFQLNYGARRQKQRKNIAKLADESRLRKLILIIEKIFAKCNIIA